MVQASSHYSEHNVYSGRRSSRYFSQSPKRSAVSQTAQFQNSLFDEPPAHAGRPDPEPAMNSSTAFPDFRPWNLESFISSTTPKVRRHHRNLSGHLGIAPCWRRDELTGCHYFSLGELWESFEEPSAYGVGVPLKIGDNETVIQYYSPSLSGIQLFSRDFCLPLLEPRHCDSDCSETDFRDSSSDSSDYDCYNDRVSGESLRSHLGSPRENSGTVVDLCDQCRDCSGGSLLLEYFELEPPHVRMPFSDKISELELKCQSIRSLKSVELHPLSWMAVAWYPIYQIPTGLSMPDLGASFLTMHSLSSPLPDPAGSCVYCSEEFWIAPASLPQVKEKNGHQTSLAIDITSIPPFGLASYKMRGSLWSSSSSDPVMHKLHASADNWLRQLSVNLPDHSFFRSHSGR